jgi:microsomal epoxide hydrolase
MHGFPDTRNTWEEVWELLVPEFPPEQGALVLAPSMRGYEPSSQVADHNYTLTDIAHDFIEWILQFTGGGQNIGKDHFVHLVGHDWGALVAFKTANLRPDLLTSIATLAIPYLANMGRLQMFRQAPEQLWYSTYMIRMQNRLFYGKALSQQGKTLPYIEGLWRYWSPNWRFSEDDLAHVCDTLRQFGVADAATAYYRCIARTARANPSNPYDWAVDFSKVPTLLLGGETDGCMSIRLYNLEMELLKDEKNTRIVKLPTVGHFMHREAPRKVTELIVDWIKG